MKKRVIVLCSGGPDGVVSAALLREQGFDPTLVFFNYGQRAYHPEHDAVVSCAEWMKMGFRCRELPSLFVWAASELTNPASTVNGHELRGRAAFVPARNLVLLALAASMAEAELYSYVALGNIAGGAYPDNQPAFREAFDEVLRHSVSPGVVIRCLAPVNEYTKADVIRIGKELRVPFERTWSCYDSLVRGTTWTHCGRCASCVGRRNAFIAAKIEDPTTYFYEEPARN